MKYASSLESTSAHEGGAAIERGSITLYRPALPAPQAAQAAIHFLVRGPNPETSRQICNVLYFLTAVMGAIIIGDLAAWALVAIDGFDAGMKVTIIGACTYLLVLASTPVIVAIQRWRRDHPSRRG